MLTARNLARRVGTRALLADIDFAVAPGSAIAVLGPNGSGKSSLLRALALVDVADVGEVAIDDRTYRFPLAARIEPPWPDVTLVFQQLFLWPHMTLRENLMLPLRKRDRGKARDPEREVLGVTSALDLQHLLDRHPNEVSLGERQRAAIARAVLLRPRYLLLDEPTSALDVEHAELLLQYLVALRKSGIGIVVVTHMLGFARRLADQFAFMDNGRIAEMGSVSGLDDPRTAHLREFVSLVDATSGTRTLHGATKD